MVPVKNYGKWHVDIFGNSRFFANFKLCDHFLDTHKINVSGYSLNEYNGQTKSEKKEKIGHGHKNPARRNFLDACVFRFRRVKLRILG